MSLPEHLLGRYDDDEDHFSKILEKLFIPAVKEAGFHPIPPAAKGSEVIHARIIGNLETSEMVLCDVSSLNVNVFFELGVRTAVGKPVCFVKDDKTPMADIPFDTTLLHHKEYGSKPTWDPSEQIKDLAAHIVDTAQKSDGKNAMLQQFSVQLSAKSTQDNGADSPAQQMIQKLDYIINRVDTISTSRTPIIRGEPLASSAARFDAFRKLVSDVIPDAIEVNCSLDGEAIIVLEAGRKLSADESRWLSSRIENFDIPDFHILWMSRPSDDATPAS